MEQKIICFYLPQFHRVKENDEWWGEGFTEWTAVKQADVYFDGHKQPRVPLNENYYNLLCKDTMEWQAGLLRDYNVYGLCFYHYWFKDGRRILEKPAENLLQWEDVEMPFCFSWANESWVRTWSNISNGNSWSFKIESMNESSKKGPAILLEQKYGDKKAWKQHFDYLLPFFKDKRYIKIDGKPIFLIYKPSDIPCLEKMIMYWKELAIKNGLNGLYFIGKSGNDDFDCFDALYNHEPQCSLGKAMPYLIDNAISAYEYDDLMGANIASNDKSSKKCFLGAFSGYDDTPRRGLRGLVVENSTPEKFQLGLTQLLKKNEKYGNEFLFLNAWNEWGEGMYVEPDISDEYSYLQAIKNALLDYKNAPELFVVNGNKHLSNLVDSYAFKIKRYESYWRVFDKWLSYYQAGKRSVDFFLKKKYFNVGLYGIGMFGKHLFADLMGSKVSVKFIIDKKQTGFYENVPIISILDKAPKVDAVVVTVKYEFEKIAKELRKLTKAKIVCIDEIFE